MLPLKILAFHIQIKELCPTISFLKHDRSIIWKLEAIYSLKYTILEFLIIINFHEEANGNNRFQKARRFSIKLEFSWPKQEKQLLSPYIGSIDFKYGNHQDCHLELHQEYQMGWPLYNYIHGLFQID